MSQPTIPVPDRTALDWGQVRQQCPKAFAELEKWLEFDWTISEDGRLSYLFDLGVERPVVLPFNPRDLYDWLDGQGVFVSMMPYQFLGPTKFSWNVIVFGKIKQTTKGEDHTRAAAETAGFTAAFGVLEKQLTSQENGKEN